MREKYGIAFLIVNLLALKCAYSQEIEGTVTDFETGTALSYANVGVPGKSTGTVSDANGKFKLTLTDKLENDSIVCSMIGYYSQKMVIKHINRHALVQFKLKQRVYQLHEVVVGIKKEFKTIGNLTKGSRKRIGIGRDQLGAELATLIHVGDKPAVLESANFYIVKNEYTRIQLRLNIYSFKDGKPRESLLTTPIYIETDLKRGNWTIDLAKYDIKVQNDIVLSLEYIQDMGFKGLYFSFDFNNSPSYFKATSQAEWNAFKYNNRPIGASFSVAVSYYQD
jgi:hypothetical protein